MIRKTLSNTKAATFCIEAPDKQMKGMHGPLATGFFISPDGFFVTAAHVVAQDKKCGGDIDGFVSSFAMTKEQNTGPLPSPYYMKPTLAHVLPELDFALLKVDFEKNSGDPNWGNQSAFPYIAPSTRELDEGEPVYAFGYPLSSSTMKDSGNMVMGFTRFRPRTTSAIVASTRVEAGMTMTPWDPTWYTLDKALNYGNSGGPIVATSTGKAHAFCSQFQPVAIPQNHMRNVDGEATTIFIPSLYGIVASLSDPRIVSVLRSNSIVLSEE